MTLQSTRSNFHQSSPGLAAAPELFASWCYTECRLRHH